MPQGLDIDYERQMNGTMPPYARHVVIRTGRSDWSSRIEDEEAAATVGSSDAEELNGEGKPVNVARILKNLTGRGGRYHDVCFLTVPTTFGSYIMIRLIGTCSLKPSRPILVTNSSLPPITKAARLPRNIELYGVEIFPQNEYIGGMLNSAEHIEDLVKCHLNARQNSANRPVRADQRPNKALEEPFNDVLRDLVLERLFCRLHASPSILICGHGARDNRCGVLGPILETEFKKRLSHELSKFRASPRMNFHPLQDTSVALISHVGGHAFAGNVVIYFPPRFSHGEVGGVSALAGKGVWYGRVEPRHIEGIIEETVKGGKIIQDLLRGVHSPPPEKE